MAEKREIIKLVVLGNDTVRSKMQLRHRYLGDGFKQSYSMTTGADFAVKRMMLEGREIVLQIWELKGNIRFDSVKDIYYERSSGIILVFDICDRSSFASLPDWISEAMENNKNRVNPMLLIGMDADSNRDREVEFEEASDYASQLSKWSGFDTPYVEVKIQTDEVRGTNEITTFDEAIEHLVNIIFNNIIK